MSCNFDEMLLSEYLDDLLSLDEKIEVNNHLSLCATCRKKIAEMKLLFFELDHLDDIEIPDEISEIRHAVVKDAFVEKEKISLETLSRTYKHIKSNLEEVPVLNKVLPTKENFASLAKQTFKTSKQLYNYSKKEPKQKKQKKRLGDLL